VPAAPPPLQAHLLLLNQTRCNRQWGEWIPRRDWTSLKVLCAKYPGHLKALCGGDAGAPLIRVNSKPRGKDLLVGLGIFTQCTPDGSGFTNVAYYRPWIEHAGAVLRGRLPNEPGSTVVLLKRP